MKKTTRRVTFSSQKNNDNVKEIEKNSTDENAHCWYSDMELARMRSNLKTEAAAYRKALGKYGFQNSAMIKQNESSCLLSPFHNSEVDRRIQLLSTSQLCFQGLEAAIFPEIVQNRRAYIRTVLRYQRKGTELIQIAIKLLDTPPADLSVMRDNLRNRVSIICTKLSKWSIDKAQAIERYHATGIYDSSLLSAPEQASSHRTIKINHKKKRNADFLASNKKSTCEIRTSPIHYCTTPTRKGTPLEESNHLESGKRKYNSDNEFNIYSGSSCRSVKRIRQISAKRLTGFMHSYNTI